MRVTNRVTRPFDNSDGHPNAAGPATWDSHGCHDRGPEWPRKQHVFRERKRRELESHERIACSVEGGREILDSSIRIFFSNQACAFLVEPLGSTTIRGNTAEPRCCGGPGRGRSLLKKWYLGSHATVTAHAFRIAAGMDKWGEIACVSN